MLDFFNILYYDRQGHENSVIIYCNSFFLMIETSRGILLKKT